MPEIQPYVDVPLRWSDMDAYAHVNNVMFLRLLEDARVRGLAQWLGSAKDVLAAGIVVARHEIDYLQPLEFREYPVRVDLWVTRVGGAGVDLGYRVTDPAPGSYSGMPDRAEGEEAPVYALAETSLVAYDFAAGKPRRISDREREVYTAMLGGPVPLRSRRTRSAAVADTEAPSTPASVHLQERDQ